MTQKICLVTGANSGVGKEIALALAQAGAHVIMVCRHAEKGRSALADIKAKSGSNSIDLLLADLSSQTAIHQLCKTIHERYAMLHVLINNAGVVLTEKKLSADGIEMTLATNHLGPFLMTQLLRDLLEKGAPSRIINISSAIHKWAQLDLDDLQYTKRKYQPLRAYAQSKLLMSIVTFEMARRLAGTNITVNCVHPGAVKTNLGSNNANNVALKWLDKFIKLFFITPQAAAQTPVYLALSPEVNNVTGKYFVKGKPVLASASSYDPDIAREVWNISAKLVCLQR